MTDLAKLAAGLTEAMRKFVLIPGYADPNTIRALCRRGLYGSGGLTETGLALQRHLLDQEKKG